MTLAKPHITRVAACGLVVKEARLLPCRISARILLDAGQWTLTGGSIDFGEAPADAMVHEVEEESRFLVRLLGLAGGVDRFTSSVKKGLLFVFLGEVTLGSAVCSNAGLQPRPAVLR